MSDQALPVPRENRTLRGHEAVEERFRRIWDQGRVHHGWLLHGPAGIGKATLAHRISRFVLAPPQLRPAVDNPQSPLEPIGDDPVLTRLLGGSHGNALVIERPYDAARAREKPEIPVDEARRASPFLRSTAAEGDWRIVIIDGAEAMNTAAANAILKLLEEPPPKCLILLISHQLGAVMPTIRSRCNRLALSPVDTTATERYLDQWFQNISHEERSFACAIAPGRPGAIGAWLHIGVGEWHAMMVSLLEQYPRVGRRAVLEAAELIGRADDAVFHGVQTLLKLLLERITRCAAGAPVMDWGDGERLASIAARAPLDTWIRLWENTCSKLDRIGYANLDRVTGLIDVIDCWSPDRADA